MVDSFLLKTIIFTFYQAVLSMLISIGGGYLLGRMLFVHKFLLLERLLSVLLLVPPITIAISFSNITGFFHLYAFPGLCGILVCHVYINLPLAALMILKGYQTIPAAVWKSCIGLRLEGWKLLINIELPLLKDTIFKSASLIFIMCFTSFTIPLLIGGKPEHNTLSVLLYYNLIIQGNMPGTFINLMVMMTICTMVIFFQSAFDQRGATGYRRFQSIDLKPVRYPQWIERAILGVSLLLFIPPLVTTGVQGFAGLYPGFWSKDIFAAINNSLFLSSVSSFTVVILALVILNLVPAWQALLEKTSYMLLVFPSFISGVTLFIIVHCFFNIYLQTFYALYILNIICGLPTALKILAPALRHITSAYDKLQKSLHLNLLQRFRWIYVPLLLPSLRLAGIIIAAYSIGDLGGILIFNQAEFMTLPGLIYDAYGRFDTAHASLISFIILAIVGAFTFLLTKDQSCYA